MADLKDRDTLRLIHAAPLPRPPAKLFEAAGRLERALAWQELRQKLRRIAAVVTLIGFGWFAHGQVGLGITDSEASPKPPAFVEDALHSHETGLLRARMTSQPEVEAYDPAEILAETGIRLPALPEDWQVRDAQVFPSRYGHSVEIAIDAGRSWPGVPVRRPGSSLRCHRPNASSLRQGQRRVLADRPTCLRADRNRQRQGHRTGGPAAVPQTTVIPTGGPWMNTPYAWQTTTARASGAVFDEGLRQHMLRVYNYMGIGLVVTGLVAFFVASTPALYVPIFQTPLKWVVMLAPLAFIFFFSFRMDAHDGSLRAAWPSSPSRAVMGLSLASVFLVFTGASIARTFFITATMFGATSLYGYTTKRDLSKFGSFLIMGLIGIIIASLVNIFLGSSLLQFAISIIGVLVFTGLTAYDTQIIKEQYAEGFGHEANSKMAVFGALSLYLNFVNIFQLLLSLTGPAGRVTSVHCRKD